MKRLWLVWILLVLGAVAAPNALAAQPPTATPAPLNIVSPVPPVEEVPGLTPSWTPTPEGQVLIEALDVANVRADADPNAAQLGQIRAGEPYIATGRYFEWIQFQFEPNRRGWVFGQLVNVTGDIASVPEIGLGEETEDVEANATADLLVALTQTPGGLQTATAAARQNTAAGSAPENADLPANAGGLLPTFTYPPGVVASAPTEGSSIVPTSVSAPPVETTTDGIPPLVPILALGGLGLLGLAIGVLRR